MISLGGSIFPGDLIQFDLSNFDKNLGMNWLHAYGAKIDCKDLKVTLTDENGQKVCIYGQREEKCCSLVSAKKANKLLCQGCEG